MVAARHVSHCQRFLIFAQKRAGAQSVENIAFSVLKNGARAPPFPRRTPSFRSAGRAGRQRGRGAATGAEKRRREQKKRGDGQKNGSRGVTNGPLGRYPYRAPHPAPQQRPPGAGGSGKKTTESMKRQVALWLLALAAVMPLAAQKGLSIAKFFDGRYRDRKDAVEVYMKGRSVERYDLTLFRSLTLAEPGAVAADMERCVRRDAARAVDSEVGMKGGRLYYGFYRLPAVGGENRYLFFRNDALGRGGGRTVTLIFMQGVATPDVIRRHFMK